MDINSNLIAKHHSSVLIVFFLDSDPFLQSYVKDLSGVFQKV